MSSHIYPNKPSVETYLFLMSLLILQFYCTRTSVKLVNILLVYYSIISYIIIYFYVFTLITQIKGLWSEHIVKNLKDFEFWQAFNIGNNYIFVEKHHKFFNP